MTPDASQLIIPHLLIARQSQGIDDVPLLLHRKQHVTLDSENERRGVGKRGETGGEGREVGGWV